MNRKLLFWFINGIITLVLVIFLFLDVIGYISWLDFVYTKLLSNIFFWAVIVLGMMLENEVYQWVKKSKRSASLDLSFIFFMFSLTFLITEDFFTGIMGAFAVYLIIGSLELKEHDVINKVILISAITYNFLFFMGIIDFLWDKLNPGNKIDLLDKSFSISFWLMLILGFVFFGRKYIVVWRFMSPQYIMLALYLLSWLFITTIGFLFNIKDVFQWIFPLLMGTNVIIYFLTGSLIDKFLGIKTLKKVDGTEAKNMVDLVEKVQDKIGLSGRVKVGFGKYPIINAMAYGPVFDKRICIIAPDLKLPLDEMEAIIAHELGHLKCNHPLKLVFINIFDLGFRWLIGLLDGFYIPATYYDITFGKKFMLFGIELDIMWYLIFNMLIFAFLYLFVRMMEANADFVVKRAKLGKQLAKALYNLESFYALGKQVGLNVVLLADEKQDRTHVILNYLSAAKTLHAQMNKPSRFLGVTTLLNSHPPTFIRIVNMLLPDDAEFSSWQETVLPGKFLLMKNVRGFSAATSNVRAEFSAIANKKFIEMFKTDVGDVDNINKFLEKLRLHGNFKELLKQEFVTLSRLEKKAMFVKIKRIVYNDSICTPFSYEVIDPQGENEDSKLINPSDHEIYRATRGNHYDIRIARNKLVACELTAIKIENDSKKIVCVFKEPGGDEIELDFQKIKNQITHETIKDIKNEEIFLNYNDAFEMLKCEDIKEADIVSNYVLTTRKLSDDSIMQVTIKDYIIDRGLHVISIHGDDKYKERYWMFFSWFKESGGWLKIFLKKPVNNDHYCQVTEISNNEKSFSLKLRDNFGNVLETDITRIDFVLFEVDTISIKHLDQQSFLEKMTRKINENRRNRLWFPK
ncbi:MAG: M48 family metalloprotease [Promethearchaeota archaeon]